ncbi:helix-turn-helix domain-containing protein [Ornithinimicrobium tianjinense]
MSRHEHSPWAQRPDFHLLLTVDEGVVWHMVDFHEYAVADGAWLWVRPGQVQRFGDLEGASGRVVMFPPDTLPPTSSTGTVLDDPFGPVLLTPSGADARAIREALDHLSAEFGSAGIPAPARSAILRHLLAVLVLRLTNLSAPVGTPRGDHAEAFLRFRDAVEQGFAEHRDVAHYAWRLGYSQRTLTRAVVAAVGVGAKEFIDRRVVLEAKRLLAHTDDPAASVAARLGFPDASNFVKYFALRAGLTPTRFRQQFRSGTTPRP